MSNPDQKPALAKVFSNALSKVIEEGHSAYERLAQRILAAEQAEIDDLIKEATSGTGILD